MRALRLGLAITVAALTAGAASCASNDEPQQPFNEDPTNTGPEASVDAGAADTAAPGFSLDSGVDANCGADCAWFASSCTPSSMCVIATGVDPASKLAGITCSATEVWAVGSQGLIVHNDGTKWSQKFLSPPNPQSTAAESLGHISLRNGGALWAMGDIFTLYTGPNDADGGASGFSPHPLPGWGASNLTALALWSHPDSPTTAWVLGDYLYRVDQTADGLTFNPYFALQPLGFGYGPAFALNAVHGATTNDIWTVGSKGLSYHIVNVDSDTPFIEELNTLTYEPLNGVWEISPTDVWAVGGDGTIRHYSGIGPTWDVIASPTTQTLTALWGASASDLWAVGDAGVVIHYDGTSWQRVIVAGLSGRKVDLKAVWGSGTDRVFAVGENVILGLGTTQGTAGPS